MGTHEHGCGTTVPECGRGYEAGQDEQFPNVQYVQLPKRRKLDYSTYNMMAQMTSAMECNINEIPEAINEMEKVMSNTENTLGVAASKAADIQLRKNSDAEIEGVAGRLLSTSIDEEVNMGVSRMCNMYMKFTQQCMKNQFTASGFTRQ